MEWMREQQREEEYNTRCKRAMRIWISSMSRLKKNTQIFGSKAGFQAPSQKEEGIVIYHYQQRQEDQEDECPLLQIYQKIAYNLQEQRS